MNLLDAPSQSPRLRWLAKHDLINRYLPTKSWHGNGTKRHMLCNRAQTRFAFGDDMAESEFAYCERYGIQHHSVTEWLGRTAFAYDEVYE